MAKPDITRCSVCSKPILSNNDCFDMGTDGLRHRKCGPGSSQWKAKFGDPKGPAALLDKAKEAKAAARSTKVSQAKDPLRQAIKEFCGRIKYMVFMDSINKTKIEWEVYSQTLGIKHTSAEPPPDPEKLYEELKA